MTLKTFLKKSKNKLYKTISGTAEPQKTVPKYEILLLTNRDSDNVGDQVIEACDIALIKAAAKNLNIPESEVKISSRAAGIISKKYLSSRDPELLKSAEKSISNCDLIIFGGAPLFNYLYQSFFERTAVTLELAQKYNKPVLFSAIGIEGYDEDNEKCQRLKKTLNFDCVKQITTRDDFISLQNYKENPDLIIDKVSDPAVFASKVFANYHVSKKENVKKKIGIFVLRANGFKDNKINFSREDAICFWKGIITELEAKNYDYELLTSGHFGDEAFLDYLIRNHNVPAEKCVFNINSPEILLSKISTYDAVISCRLHPSIISYSFDIPTLGIVWNYKVKYFYTSVGHEDRVIEVDNISPQLVVEKVEQIISEGVKKDKDYLVSVYQHLFTGIKNVLRPEDTLCQPYTYDELIENLPYYKGTSKKELDLKLNRKFRRTYEKYNNLFDKNIQNQKLIKELKEEIQKLQNES